MRDRGARGGAAGGARTSAPAAPLHPPHPLRTASAPLRTPPHPSAPLRTPPHPLQAALDGATQREEEARAEANELVGEVQREFAAELNQLTAQSRQVRLTSS